MAGKETTILVQCTKCGGDGLYAGFAEPTGTAVICLACKGSGAETLKYAEYAGRVRRTDAPRVYPSRGQFVATGVGSTGGRGMSYDDFLTNIPEAPLP